MSSDLRGITEVPERRVSQHGHPSWGPVSEQRGHKPPGATWFPAAGVGPWYFAEILLQGCAVRLGPTVRQNDLPIFG